MKFPLISTCLTWWQTCVEKSGERKASRTSNVFNCSLRTWTCTDMKKTNRTQRRSCPCWKSSPGQRLIHHLATEYGTSFSTQITKRFCHFPSYFVIVVGLLFWPPKITLDWSCHWSATVSSNDTKKTCNNQLKWRKKHKNSFSQMTWIIRKASCFLTLRIWQSCYLLNR